MTHRKGFFCKMRHADGQGSAMIRVPLCKFLSFNRIPLAARVGMGLGGEGDAALGDGDEGSEGIMQWFLLILV